MLEKNKTNSNLDTFEVNFVAFETYQAVIMCDNSIILIDFSILQLIVLR